MDFAYGQILSYLPPELRERLAELDGEEQADLEEVRLRCGCPVQLRFGDREAFLTARGRLSPQAVEAPRLSKDELRRAVLLLTGSSLYALEEELRRGYLTLPGGHRVGLAGHAVLEGGAVRTLRDVSSLNIRLARPHPGAAQQVLPQLRDGQGGIYQTLLISPPRAGKTTLLRELTRMLADGEGGPPLQVGLVDERSELAALKDGQPQLPVGLRCDVLDGCPKAEGLMMLLRAMSPQVLVCDELGRPEDAAALAEAAHAGVKVLATAHAQDEQELRRRPVLGPLLDSGCFQRLVVLSRRHGPGTVERIYAPSS